MSSGKTLFVVGAGASKEVGLPTGAELRSRISDLLDIRPSYDGGLERGDLHMYNALVSAARARDGQSANIGEYIHAGHIIRDAMPQSGSIDAFIDMHSGNHHIELCGKLSIVHSILKEEKNSPMYVDPSNIYNQMDVSSFQDTWYTLLFQLITAGCRIETLPERLKSLTFVVFNYDRCLEHYLFHAFMISFDVSPEESARLVSSIAIHHPYGAVGSLPWQHRSRGIQFGAEVSPPTLATLVGEIKTFAEGTDPAHSEIMQIRRSVSEATVLVFLGFAFHRQNVDLLRSRDGPRPTKRSLVFGTAKGLSNADCDVVRSELLDLQREQPAQIHIRNDLRCSELFHEYSRSLSL